MIRYSAIFKIIGILLCVIGILIWTTLPFSFYYDSGDDYALFISGLISIVVGLPFAIRKLPEHFHVNKREGYLIVALGWLTMVVCGMLPFLVSGMIPNVADALFESVSGLTTTGATILEDIESNPKGILLWRSMIQWIGGMGIIVLTVALFPLLGFGGIELFVAEAPGPKSDKIHPRIRETAKRLWLIYVTLTLVLCAILYFAGMTPYDAINHAFTTMATGGFSTKNASIAHWDDPFIQYPIALFMLIAGTNYSVLYFLFKFKTKRVWQNEEFRIYLFLVLFISLLVTFVVWGKTGVGFEKSFRTGLFMVISVITTTGYVTADYTVWGNSMLVLFFVLMFSGACAGSTSGGIKLIRHVVFFKNSILEFKRILHPRAIVPLKLSRSVVPPRIMTHILVFLLIYLAVFIVGSVMLAAMGIDFDTSIGAVATSLGNVGPGIGKVGPVDNFAWLPVPAKLVLCFIMLAGRLELFTILILFTPYFWKSN